MFISASFWHTVVFQACQSEPAVLHAALTLSCVHRGGISTDQTPEFCDDNLDDQETFVLRQYLKAISHLSALLAKRDRSSIRIALVACVLFVCLEFLRGHFQTAQVHLQNGLKVLAEQQAGGTTRADTGILSLQAHGEPVDDHIVEALYRLHVQVELFNCTYQRPGLVLQRPGPSFLPSRFSTVREASKEMDRLLNKVFALSQRAFQQQASQGLPVQGPSTLNNCQQHIQAELKAWLDTFKASAETLQKEAQTKAFVYQLLKGYHAMASIMAGTCLRGYDESVFDSYTEQFVTIIDLFSQHREMRPVPVLSQAPGQRLNMARSVIDIGWIPPLYYTALKCRVHRVRLQAVQLLESTSHREGIWDSKIAACVARKVMDLEEGASNGGIGVRDNLEPFNSPSRNDTLLFTVPQRRINDVEVVLPNSCADGPMLVCRQRSHTEDCKEWAERYDSIGERWVKVSLGQYSSTQHL